MARKATAGNARDGPDPKTPAELLARAKQYARTVPLPLDYGAISWEISHRAKRRAGVCLFDASTEEITIRLTWAAYEAFGWDRFTATIRHELIHALEFRRRGESGHGEFFERKARELDAPRYCPRFSTPNYWVVCADCANRIGRYRRSKLVKNPDAYRCGDCGGELRVERVDAATE